MVSDSTHRIIYEKEIPVYLDDTRKYKCRYEYREIEGYNHPITKAELIAELKKRKDKSNILTLLCKEGFTDEAVRHCTSYYPRVRVLVGGLDLIRHSHK